MIPTGWYPNSVSVSADGGYLYVVNAIGGAGPNPQLKDAQNHNQYVLQMRPAGLLSMPVPSPRDLSVLTKQVLFNSGVRDTGDRQADRTMAWEEKMKGQDFRGVDKLGTNRFNRVLWEGRMGPDVPYPTHRHGLDLSQNREALLAR